MCRNSQEPEFPSTKDIPILRLSRPEELHPQPLAGRIENGATGLQGTVVIPALSL